jgi:hypothetical protein
MINITRNKKLFVQQMLIAMKYYELKMYRKIRAELNKIFREVSIMIEHGDPLNIVPVIVNKHSQKMLDIFKIEYKRIGTYNFENVNRRLQEIRPKKISDYYKKDSEHNFWYYYNLWLNGQALSKSRIIDGSTKKILRSIIDKGIRDAKSYNEIAKDIVKKTELNKNRAMMIATTEVHTAFNKSTFESIESNNVKMESKEWINVGDERVRRSPFNHVAANGETVPMHEKFTQTGGALMYPGDISSEGSAAANIIRCRCQVLYNTEVTEIE